MQSDTAKETDLDLRIASAISELRKEHPNFDNAYDTYTQEYGTHVVHANLPAKLSGTIDPALLILGRNTTVYYNDSERTIKGQDGAMQLGDETTVIIGRRQPQDSKLVVWSKQAEIEIGEYNPRAGIIPSRVHGAFVSIQGGVYYTDLCSSSGTVIVGDSSKEGQFVKIYDSGTAERPRLKVDTIYMSRKA